MFCVFIVIGAVGSTPRPFFVDIYKNDAILTNMKTTRSTVGKGLNLSTRVEKQRKGRGAYVRKSRYNRYE